MTGAIHFAVDQRVLTTTRAVMLLFAALALANGRT